MNQVWHPWTDWECYRAGMFDGEVSVDPGTARAMYANFLRDIPRFEAAMQRVLLEWPISCEHFLTNVSMNRIAWLGQAAMCMETGIPRTFRGGFNEMNLPDRRAANAAAQRTLDQYTCTRS